jgi:aconitate hydratase
MKINKYKKELYKEIEYFDINISDKVKNLPFSIKILLENIIRNSCDEGNIKLLINYKDNVTKNTIDFYPARILMQDFTGVPALVDLAALRDAVLKAGKNAAKVNPKIPVDLVIDHSIQVDHFGTGESSSFNKKKEYERNYERYKFLKWGKESFSNLRVVPPGTGICHQVNLEYLAKVVWSEHCKDKILLYPDTLVGTDSHTTMINGLSVLGWGVGGIEAEAVMLGEPISMVIPEVIGVNLYNNLKPGVTATDLVLTITNLLRMENVVGKFVEFFGDGLKNLSIADRATIANMAPECGSTCNFFPVDQKTLDYLDLTGREKQHIEIVEKYSKVQMLWNSENTNIDYISIINLDLADVKTTLAGPKRPQDKVLLSQVPENFQKNYNTITTQETDKLRDGAIVIAAITSCTNTSNPRVMIGAGLMAKKASELGLKVKPWVKTSLAPGSNVVSEYLEQSGLQKYLDNLGFNIVGYGCTTCIGNSGPLPEKVSSEITDKNLIVASILSGNRNFEGRIHSQVKANYLASPILVVAYALAGFIDINLEKNPITQDKNGKGIFLKDLWPLEDEITEYIHKYINKKMFQTKYSEVFKGDKEWIDIDSSNSLTYQWDENNTYVKNPPFFENVDLDIPKNICDARIIGLFGDSVTTDHISPAGSIAKDSPAAQYLQSIGVDQRDFNSYGARRGNHEVMMRGTFANIRIKNKLFEQITTIKHTETVEGGYTIHFGSGQRMNIYDAAMLYKREGIPLVILAGKEYGTGSSRDWAAKGTKLLGIKAVIAESFERIHRSNLVRMGVLPLIFQNGENIKSLELKGDEKITISYLDDLNSQSEVECIIIRSDKSIIKTTLKCAINTEKEVEYFKCGGILQYVLYNS